MKTLFTLVVGLLLGLAISCAVVLVWGMRMQDEMGKIDRCPLDK